MPDNNYNPLRRNVKRDCFNNARTTRVFTENCDDINDECATKERIVKALIEKTIKDLQNEN